MNKKIVFAAGLICCSLQLNGAGIGSQVMDYQTGDGTTENYRDPSAALGFPSRETVDPMFGTSPVNPFSPPYLGTQVVSVGAGGSLTLKMSEPIRDLSSNPFGADFMVFGNSGFVITNGFDDDFNFIGEPATDGSLFGATDGSHRISVSADNVQWFTLDPALAPSLDALFPTDGEGVFTRSVDPALGAGDFAGATLEGIRALYNGSGGGAGFDLGWARTADGAPASLDSVQYVRIDVLSGVVQVDGVVAVPEPGTMALGLVALAVGCWRMRKGMAPRIGRTRACGARRLRFGLTKEPLQVQFRRYRRVDGSHHREFSMMGRIGRIGRMGRTGRMGRVGRIEVGTRGATSALISPPRAGAPDLEDEEWDA